MKLVSKPVEKVWGRTALPFACADAGDALVGELWFNHPGGAASPLLVKFIFTAAPLSVQVHPDDRQARERGLPHGKSECWYIVDAEPGAAVALGLTDALSRDQLRAAALDGTIARRLAWRPVCAGDFFYIPAGTIHAIGGGVSLIEVQQPSDVTYRLFDHGRARELHIEEAVAVARREPYPDRFATPTTGDGVQVLVSSPHFTLVRVAPGAEPPSRLEGRDRWVVPLDAAVCSRADEAALGECLFVPAGEPLTLAPGASCLIAVEGAVQADRLSEPARLRKVA
ncbi:MAG TPA: class I mannose-6-phosphate isomerase [Allosphingosinicella sp.]|jgi:mannose-6-phosphate isomerase